MKLKNLVLLIVFIVIVVSFFTFNLYPKKSLCAKSEIPISFTIGDNIGFNVEDDSLKYGTLPAGGTFTWRNITITNDGECGKCKVELRIDNQFSEWTYTNENNFYLEKGESRQASVYLYVPEGVDYGDYSGLLEIYFWKTI